MSNITSVLALQDRMSRTLNTIERAAQNANSTFQALSNQVNRLNTQMNVTQRANLSQLNNSLSNANNTSRQLTNNYTQGNNALQKMIGMVGKLGLAIGGIAGIKSLIGLSDETTGIRARLNLLVDDGGSLEALEQQIFDSANRVGVEYAQVADIVGKIGNQAGDAFSSNSEVVAFSELLEKTFSNAGADATAISSTMYNLTQSLSSGKLLGNDYRILKQNAPQMIKYLRDFYGVTAEGLDKMVTAGQVTSTDIKNAMFTAAEDINTTFNNMPITWSNAMARIKNYALKAFDPILRKINDVANSERFTKFSNNIANALYTIGNVATQVFDGIINIVNFVSDNIGGLIPIIGGIITALLIYKGVQTALNIVTWAGGIATSYYAFVSSVLGAKQMLATGATLAQTAAQWGLNAALLACPITWIIIGIIALIAIISAVIIAVNKAKGESVSAIGVVAGVIATAGAIIWNIVLGLLDMVLGVINYIANRLIAFGNFLSNVFKDPIGSIIHLFGDMGDRVLGIIQSIASAIDKVFGSNLASAVQGWKNNLNGWIEEKANKYGNGKYEKVVKNINLTSESLGLKRWAYGDAYNTGYNWGANLFGGKASEKAQDEPIDYKSIMSGLKDVTGTDSTGGKAVKTTTDDKLLSDEDIQLLLDLATRDYKLNYQQVTPQITMTFGDIRENADVDVIADQLAERLQEIVDGNLEVQTV